MNTRAIILIGPSNAGKSPLGEALQQNLSTPSHRILHLDFGEHLRKIASRKIQTGLGNEDISFVQAILDGTLLDDAHFYIARNVISWFCEQMNLAKDDILLLNGLPRHLGQARALQEYGIHVLAVLFLNCSPQSALARKQMADKGKGHEDRSNRGDGDLEIFQKRQLSFKQKTLPLIDYYRERNAEILTVDILPDTSPAEACDLLSVPVSALAAE